MANSSGKGEKEKGATKGGNNNNNNSNKNKNNSNNKSGAGGKGLLSVRYPVNSAWEFTLPNDEVVEGTVYCTDEISQTVVLQKPLVHTTLTFEVRMVQVASIKKEKLVSSSTENTSNTGEDDAPLSKPLPVVQKKVLEERERKAIKLAEERFRQINQDASAEGQAIFDRLVKACGDDHVVWEGTSIKIGREILVDAPYSQEKCSIIPNSSGTEGALDRVKKIVAAS